MPPPMVQPTPDPPDVMNLPLAVVVSQFPPLFYYRVFESDGSLHLEVEFNEEPTVKDMVMFLRDKRRKRIAQNVTCSMW